MTSKTIPSLFCLVGASYITSVYCLSNDILAEYCIYPFVFVSGTHNVDGFILILPST